MVKKAQKSKVSKQGQRRVGVKIKHLVDTGEVPNTPQGRKEAAGMAYGMERKHRLSPTGAYKPVKKKGKKK